MPFIFGKESTMPNTQAQPFQTSSGQGTSDHSVTILIILAVLVIGAMLLGKERLDNPLVILIIFALFTAAFFSVGRLIGNSTGMPGLTSFFGGNS